MFNHDIPLSIYRFYIIEVFNTKINVRRNHCVIPADRFGTLSFTLCSVDVRLLSVILNASVWAVMFWCWIITPFTIRPKTFFHITLWSISALGSNAQLLDCSGMPFRILQSHGWDQYVTSPCLDNVHSRGRRSGLKSP